MHKITVIGSLNMDLVVNTPKVPSIGETLLGSGFMTVPGGKGANQAVAAARLGGQVSMIGCVGNDIFGKDLIKNLQDNRVDVKSVKIVDESSTGVAMIVVENGDNFIIVDPGANFRITPQMIDSIEMLIKSSYIIMLQLEIPYDIVDYAVNMAYQNNVKVLLNPAPARRLSDELLSKVDIFTPNELECEMITGIPIKSVEDAKTAVEYLRNKGIGNVIITMGKNGVVYNSGDSIIHKPVPKVKVMDTTAAGDSFSGAVAVALTESESIDEAVDFGNKVGTLTVMKKGAQISLPSRLDVDEFEKTVIKM